MVRKIHPNPMLGGGGDLDYGTPMTKVDQYSKL